MSLKDLFIKSEYRSFNDDIVKDFYIPLLNNAVLYKRAVGFFSSSALVEISKGITGLVKNGGKIMLVASPYLSEEDIEAIQKGYQMRNEVFMKALMRELKDPKSIVEGNRLNLLANLIAEEILDIKVAFLEKNNKLGMYHEKVGIIIDGFGNKVAFSGSMNESATAMTFNYEAIDVFCSWKGEENRVLSKEQAFDLIWNNQIPTIKAIEFPELKEEIIKKYKKKKINYDIDEFDYDKNDLIKEAVKPIEVEVDFNRPLIPSNIVLHNYQIEAIDEWEKQGFKGIFDMATGTGKTYTGLGALVRLAEKVENRLAVFIVCPYQHLVEQWVEDIKRFNIEPIIGYSSSPQKDWKEKLEKAIIDQKLKVKNREFLCFICTNATFSSPFVQLQINKIRGNALLLVDEAHNFGSTNLSKLLSEKFNYRLALSATFERHRDEEGTAKLISYFGNKCIEYDLERAIKEKKLTEYKYYPIIISLTEEELMIYNKLTNEIGRNIIKDKQGNKKLNEKAKRLVLKRAKLVAGAKNKIYQLEEYIKPYINDKHILVYCGATTILDEDQDYSSPDEEDLRQIDVVTDLLGNKLKMKVSQFTSREDIKEREILKREFAKGDNLQALIAIKCLDEGVNIPNIKVAFILASTTNPKEYIQRRGRVLRLAEGKKYAEIYDFITIPRTIEEATYTDIDQIKKELTLVKNELVRGEEFARLALNSMEAWAILEKIKKAYSINLLSNKWEEDYGGIE